MTLGCDPSFLSMATLAEVNKSFEASKKPEEVPPFPRPDIWPILDNIKGITPAERANEMVLDFILSETPYLYGVADERFGMQYLGADPNRKKEGGNVGIDVIAEKHTIKTLRKLAPQYELSLLVLSEGKVHKIGRGKPQFVVFMDEYDNSKEYEFNADTPGHLCISFWNPEVNVPIATADGNLFRKHIVINFYGRNFLYNPNTGIVLELPTPPLVRSIKDKRFGVASYDGSDKYIRIFNQNLDKVNRDRDPKGLFQGKSGAHTYHEMALAGLNGKGIMAYPIFGEPVSEYLPGWGLAKTAEFKSFSVNTDDGYMQELIPDISFYIKHPERYSKDRIPYLIVARTIELAKQIRDITFKKSLLDWTGFKMQEEWGV